MGSNGAHSVTDLIKIARENPPEPVVSGLLNVGCIALIHAPEESFKSFFSMQFAAAISMGGRFVRAFDVPKARSVGIIQTEIHPNELGQRLAKMFPDGSVLPKHLHFAHDGWMQAFRRLKTIDDKLKEIHLFVRDHDVKVLVIDPAGDLFRDGSSPNDETEVGAFFDGLRTIPLEATVLVRHDKKPKPEDHLSGNSNDRISGSAEWKEDPETILFLRRED